MIDKYEYLVLDSGFMSTNRTGQNSVSGEKVLSDRLTSEYGSMGWKLVAQVNDDLVFMRKLEE